MVRLREPRSDMPADEPCLTEEEIFARVIGGKQRGHIPGVGKVVPFLKRPRVNLPPPAPPGIYSWIILCIEMTIFKF